MFKSFRFVFLVLVLIALFFAAVFTVSADDSPEATPTVEAVVAVTQEPTGDVVNNPNPSGNPDDPYKLPIPQPDEVANKGLEALFALFSGLITFLATTPLVSLLKVYVPPFNLKNKDGEYLFTGDQINLIVAIIISLATWGATLIGYGTQVTAAWEILFRSLPVLASVTGVYFGTQTYYNTVKGKMPLVGYSRTDEKSYTPLEVRLQGEVDSLRSQLLRVPKDLSGEHRFN